jgi:hypothetical protein
MKEIIFYESSSNSKYGPGVNPLLMESSSLAKVLGYPTEQKVKWLFSAPNFDVFLKGTTLPYESSLYHSFSNARVKTERFELGKTHVAIGFVDLSILLWMDLLLVPPSTDSPPQPFHFVGFEMSPFSVAKTSVISAMLHLGLKSSSIQEKEKITDAILQVWYSSCWNQNTLEYFQLGLSEAKKKKACADKDVLDILEHWSGAQAPSLKEARQEWLKKIDESLFDPVVNVSIKSSRQTLTHYFLTGQLLEASMGSIVMFELPEKFKFGRSRNESVFHSLDMTKLARSTKQNKGDFVQGALSLLRSQISKVHDLVLRGLVSITMEPPSRVSLDNPQIISKISSLNPFTMSWNNCLDYMTIQDFHRLAKACSAPEDTIHFGYSMNWPCDVKGSCCLTMPVGPHMMDVMKGAREGISFSYQMGGLSDLLVSPPIDNPINVLDVAARACAYRYWVNEFFRCVPNVGPIEPSFYNPFARACSCLFLTWTYDEAIRFTRAN